MSCTVYCPVPVHSVNVFREFWGDKEILRIFPIKLQLLTKDREPLIQHPRSNSDPISQVDYDFLSEESV